MPCVGKYPIFGQLKSSIFAIHRENILIFDCFCAILWLKLVFLRAPSAPEPLDYMTPTDFCDMLDALEVNHCP